MTAWTISAIGMRTFARRYPGECGQPRLVRAALAVLLDACPHADDAILIASELAANAAVHSDSAAPGGQFTVRAEVHHGDCIWIEVEDQGGPWARRRNHDGYAHGLDLVDALAGTGNWGIKGGPQHGRIVWARLAWPGELLARMVVPSVGCPPAWPPSRRLNAGGMRSSLILPGATPAASGDPTVHHG